MVPIFTMLVRDKVVKSSVIVVYPMSPLPTE